MISKTGEAETITSHYLFALGSYRALYIINWAYRFYMEDYYDLIAIVAGGVQTALYCDFFYLYITKGVCVCVEGRYTQFYIVNSNPLKCPVSLILNVPTSWLVRSHR